MDNLLTALWLFFPAAAANAAPVFAARIYGLRRFNQPVDGGRRFHGHRLLGPNKTWRGLIVGVLVAIACGYLQNRLQPELLPLWFQLSLAAAIGFGALYGDMVASFFKRQSGKKSGQTWFPVDQLDYIGGGLIAALPYGVFDFTAITAIVVIYFLMHLGTVYIGYRFGLRDQPI